MSNEAVLVAVALIGGVAVSLQGQFMGQLDRQIGTAESVFITYGMGALIALLIILMMKGGQLATNIANVPWYTLSSGLLGLVIVASIGFTIPRMGMTKAFTLLLAAQFLLAALIDHFGWFGSTVRTFDWKQLAGVGLILSGVMLLTR
ncbi:DMT family transporter [Aestuariirhabdus litorea]|uniref:DMT family transporter n=1 Tax=Aestuariirhabdus litorea TaxID=2528527 RepID=A0A3P3VR08_9GAMM|nr:DMT family transporter [Aestuariirhabdus litorea]RRJ84106.1 DMT family transporter [Aestuariirhabdus litorea]RWW97326.1 DMT family transporter [Endozoicomonadaceae bacterium GTF-13]